MFSVSMLRSGAKSCIIMCTLVKLGFFFVADRYILRTLALVVVCASYTAPVVYGVGKVHLLHCYFVYVSTNVSATQQPGKSPIY